MDGGKTTVEDIPGRGENMKPGTRDKIKAKFYEVKWKIKEEIGALES
jgi:hypothetical protein